jgi:hypothetical protein
MRLLRGCLLLVGCGTTATHGGADGGRAADAGQSPGDAGRTTADAARGSADATRGSADAGPPADGRLPGSVWHPAPRTSWQWQLSGTIDTTVDVAMYDIDLFDNPQPTIDTLHADGRIVICYFSAGTYENWRPDIADFPSAAIGNGVAGWPGENWLDVRDATVRNVLAARMDLAVSKHCDGLEPDNVDGYQNNSGFPLSAADQLDFDNWLATQGHARGLSVGLKNDLDQIPDLEPSFDWALDEECVKYSECAALAPFISDGKAVFHVEYGDATLVSTVCPVTQPLQFSTLIKDLNLDAFRIACP